ncbi:hypothetical protein NP493_619g02017 [Ridgeia piscesae]|uniref:EGF-like domain-containing protein n=1 Tax=Ridgeia piscesae TaxID=27915 RepID=A0AAD9NQJ8_RIDPI|nr:hypothetical protein NP493_619g02017 [Ridgeia piscesae]
MALARTSGHVLANPDNTAVFWSRRKQLELRKTLQLYVYMQIHQPMADRKSECKFRPLVNDNVASACYSPLHFGFRRVFFTRWGDMYLQPRDDWEKTCSDGPCENGATCTDISWGGVICQCLMGYAGHLCQRNVTCADNPCDRKGECIDNIGGGVTCRCPDAFIGGLKRCSDGPCKNGSTCIDISWGGVECLCVTGDGGQFCERKLSCRDKPCRHSGSCVDNTDGGVNCTCTQDFIGEYCERELTCADVTCLHDGLCTNMAGGGVKCKCPLGVSGRRCEST